jgi:hypothetical protein
VRYVRPCPLMPSVTMGIDAAVTANTNACNTATRELTPHLIFQGPSFWSPQNPHPETTRTIFQRPGSMQFYPRPSLMSSTIRAFGLARSEIMDRCRHAATRTGYLFARSDWD